MATAIANGIDQGGDRIIVGGDNPDLSSIEPVIDRILDRNPVVGLAIGVVRDGKLAYFHGHGLADIPSATPITEDTVFRIASITKTFTAVAVMQLWEKGLVHLDAPVGEYLTSYRLIPADPGWRPVTLRHLLTHTAGLGELAHPSGMFKPDFGESFPVGSPLPSLAGFYGGGLKIHAEPGTRFVYNNHGPATLGQVVEDVTGERLDRYFREHIFGPLGMDETDLVRSEEVTSRLATGYEIKSSGVEEVEEREMVTAGAASIYSTPADMARYVGALLGRGEVGSVLEPRTLELMFEPEYRPDARIPGMGLGFFRSELGGHQVVGHQGTHPGFHSQILLVPEAGVGVMGFTNGAHQADFWLPAAVKRLLETLVASPDRSGLRTARHHPEIWVDLCGWYSLSACLTDVRLRGMMGAGAEVFVRNGRLMLRFLTPIPALAAGLPLHPDDPDDPHAFRIELPDEYMAPIRIVFGHTGSGRINRLHLDVMPLTLHKQADRTNPRRWLTAAGAVGFTGIALSRLNASVGRK
jgi:CubicO group peptidase (beta-lactamase class C family)